ncbi:Alpha/beta hydrolase family-domain-containing protein [Cyathus striatus]|nr:Alpha/beta hydrolase family-domain-containing protein [Cyathus striatus]
MKGHPPPSEPLPEAPTVNPRRRLEVLETPPAATSPSLPSPPRSPVFTSTHSLSTHIIPAAYPRSPSTPGTFLVPNNLKTKEERQEWVKQTVGTMLKEKRGIEAGVQVGQVKSEQVLWSVVNRIARNVKTEDGKKGLTLVVTNPIGFHKEIWEPALKALIEFAETASSAIRIEEIWVLESVCHGDSGLVNAQNMSRLPDRADYGRDIANLCINYIPDQHAPGTILPLHLPRMPERISSSRIKNGFEHRTLVNVGHSLGGDAAACFALNYPALPKACVLIETTIFPRPIRLRNTLSSSWKSRKEAREGLLKSPMFQAFHPDVFEVYLTYGLYEDPKTRLVKLKCDPAWEASEFTENRTNAEIFELLPTLDERVELRWILGGKEGASNLVGGDHIAQRTVWRRPKNASNVRLEGAGHLVVQETPREAGQEIFVFLEKFGLSRDAKAKL